jgi:hypothetical protein
LRVCDLSHTIRARFQELLPISMTLDFDTPISRTLYALQK